MKFETTLNTLLEATSITSRFTEKKTNLPVLGCVLLVVEGNRIILRATNLECGVEVVIPAKVSSDGIAAVPASVLNGFLSNTRGKTISAAITGELFKIETERAQASIKTLSYDDFPVLPRESMFSFLISLISRRLDWSTLPSLSRAAKLAITCSRALPFGS